MNDLSQSDFKTRQQMFVDELNILQEKYGVRLVIRTMAEQVDDNSVLVKGRIHAVPAPDWPHQSNNETLSK